MSHNAKERLEDAKRAITRLKEVRLLISEGCDEWRPPNVARRRQLPNPTANAAIRNVDEVDGMIEALRREETELKRTIAAAILIVQAVREGLGDKYADVLRWRYLDCMTWVCIRKKYDTKKSTGIDRLNVAFDWVDSIGMTRILAGDLEI